MKNIIKLFGAFIVILSAGFTTTINAQQSNVIKEVNINSNDGFSELRNLVVQNFDFTNPNLTEGKINSEVKFNVSENGKIDHVSVNGDCKYVNQELQEVMTHLLYRFDDSSKINKSYVLPITVFIASR